MYIFWSYLGCFSSVFWNKWLKCSKLLPNFKWLKHHQCKHEILPFNIFRIFLLNAQERAHIYFLHIYPPPPPHHMFSFFCLRLLDGAEHFPENQEHLSVITALSCSASGHLENICTDRRSQKFLRWMSFSSNTLPKHMRFTLEFLSNARLGSSQHTFI